MKPSLGIAISVALAGGIALAAISIPESTLTGTDDVAVRDQQVTFQASAGASANAKPVPKPLLVKLEIEAPKYESGLPLGIMFSSGWPIVFKAVARDDALGIAVDSQPSEFPTSEETGYVVFADPDGCLALPEPFIVGYNDPDFPNPANPCPAYDYDPDGDPSTPPPPPPRPASDETYLEFANDVDLVGVADHAGNPGRSLALGDAVSGAPVFNGAIDTSAGLSTGPVAVGPATGLATNSGVDDSIDDGVGYGADDDFPGLVLLSPRGVGLVLDADFDPPYVRQQRNLAGFLNWVAYELRSATGNTVVHAGMVVPYGLVAPLMRTDDCIGTSLDTFGNVVCSEPSRYRIDGGPLVTAASFGSLQFNYPREFEATIYELRAFVVSGVAPSLLADMNNDGVVAAADATLAGYHVISNEKVIRLRQYHGNYCGGISFTQQSFFADIDGNGRVSGGVVCPAGPGQITRPPQ